MKFTYVKDNTNVSLELSDDEYRHTLTLLDNMDFDLGDKLTKTIDYALITMVNSHKAETELRNIAAVQQLNKNNKQTN